ncbi:PLP-dependent aminotransferase family protein [Paracoccus luteus]|uniref:aminotransferase-like domain-containing protein n=1 Tax=Paracoccus luteus TaxID=2508543 RepID=UPI001C704F4A|nr:PLP-dependent aminotransferase family protein [Paracoccus luteus]
MDANWLAARMSGRSARAIAHEVSALIRSGELPVGAQLPTIRELAREMGVSPATVSQAWKSLRRHRVIEGSGRRGTRVSASVGGGARPERMASVANYGPDIIDLSRAAPDTRLLPALEPALAAGAAVAGLNSYDRERILPALDRCLRRDWPYDAGALLAVNGGYNGIYTALHALIRPGAVIAVEHPTPMRLLDILEDMDLTILPVDCDDQGPRPDLLAQALAQRPSAFLFQPRLHGATGHMLTPARLTELRDVLAASDTLIIEDDGVGDLAMLPRQSLGRWLPDRVIHILSFSKSLGPDLRLAVMSSTVPLIEEIQAFRLFSSGWTSRILQGAACWLLQDAQAQALLDRARRTYQDRRDALATRLRDDAIPIGPGGGLCLRAPVRSESYALVTLAARGIAVQPGSKSSFGPSHHVRIATGIMDERVLQATAPHIVLACKGG